MKLFKLAVVLSILGTASAFADTSAGAGQDDKVINYSAPGNLQSLKPTHCVSMEQISTEQTPADIFVGIKACLAKEDYTTAADLFVMALAYGKFDMQRVADTSAHQAISVMRINTFAGVPQSKIDQLQAEMGKAMANRGVLCKKLVAQGYPSYYPAYMIQHGIKAFNSEDKSKALVEGFNAEEGWNAVLTKYVKCADIAQ